MNDDLKNLRTFGYGLALLPSFLIFFRVLHRYYHQGNFLIFLISFIALLILITRMTYLKAVYNCWAFIAIFAVILLKIRTGFTVLPIIFLGLSVGLLFLTIFQLESLRPLYALWMKGVHAIGLVLSTIILALTFYLVFGLAGIVLRLIKKDLLDQKIEPQRTSYWQERKDAVKERSSYLQQF